MAKELTDNTGRAYPNKYKKEDKDPAIKGTIMINGELKDISLWENNGQYGVYYNVKIYPHKPKNV